MPQATDAVWIDVLPSMEKFGPTLAKGANAQSSAVGASSGKAFGKAMLAGTAVVAGGAVLAAKALYNIGSTFDDVTDTIRVGTGATGKALDALTDSAKNVGKQVPADFKDVGTAIADVNTRLGLTGKPLENITAQFLELSRITGTDVASNIENVSRVFGDWGVKAKDQSASLDYLFKVSQSTGIGIDDLSQKVVQFGAPMRQFGFSFEESAALMGKWAKEGVNTETVMGGLRAGLGKLSKAGKDPEKAFASLTKRIKNAGSVGDANAIAIETFGQRAGPDLAAAVREGRFDLDDLLDSLKGSKETIKGAGKDTMDFSEKWAIFKNKILVGLEPLASRVFAAVGDGMDWVSKVGVPAIKGFADEFSHLKDLLSGAASGGMVKSLQGIASAALDLGRELLPTLRDIGERIMGVLVPAFKDISNIVLRDFLPAFRDAMPVIKPVAEFILKVVGGAIVGVIKGAVQTIKGLLNVITGVFKLIKAVVTGDWSAAWKAVKQILRGALDAVVGAIKVWFNFGILGIFKQGAKFLLKSWRGLWEGIKGLGKKAWDGLRSMFGKALGGIQKVVVGAIKGYLRLWINLFKGLRDLASVGWKVLRSAFGGAIAAIRTVFVQGMKKIKDAFTGAWTSLKNTGTRIVGLVRDTIPKAFAKGRDLIGKAWDGIKNLAKAPVNFVINTVYNNGIRAAFNKIADFLGSSTRLPYASAVGGGSSSYRPPSGGGVQAYGGASRLPKRLIGESAGGPIDWIKGLAKKPVSWVKDKFGGMVNGLIGKVGSSPFAQMAGGVIRRVAGMASDWLGSKLAAKKAAQKAARGAALGAPGPGGRVLPAGSYRIGMPYMGYPGHYGADYPAATGTPVYSPWPGRVTATYDLPGSNPYNNTPYRSYGRVVKITHDNGLSTLYAHLSSRIGSTGRIGAGTMIGRVGSNGNSTGPHLHFEARRGGIINPANLGLFDNGGLLKQGMLAYHAAKKPDKVLTDAQFRDMHTLAQAAQRGRGGDGAKFYVTTSDPLLAAHETARLTAWAGRV